MSQKRVLKFIHANPGAHKSGIKQALGMGWGTVCFHTDNLIEAKKIHAIREGARVHMFEQTVPEPIARCAVALRQRHSQMLLELIEAAPDTNVSELARQVGAARRTIRVRLQHLQDAGLLRPTLLAPLGFALNRDTVSNAKKLAKRLA